MSIFTQFPYTLYSLYYELDFFHFTLDETILVIHRDGDSILVFSFFFTLQTEPGKLLTPVFSPNAKLS